MVARYERRDRIANPEVRGVSAASKNAGSHQCPAQHMARQAVGATARGSGRPVEGKDLLLIVDACSKWTCVKILKNTTSRTVIKEMQEEIYRFGIPTQIMSDNGPQFRSEEFAMFCKELGIHHILAAPYHPRSNGQVERYVGTIKGRLAKREGKKESLKDTINKYLMFYHSTPHASTGQTPSSLMIGRLLRNPLDLMMPNNLAAVQRQHARMRKQGPKVNRSFEVNDSIYYLNMSKYGTPFIHGVVIQKCGPVSYIVRNDDGDEEYRHVDHIKRGPGEDIDDELDLDGTNNASPAEATEEDTEEQQRKGGGDPSPDESDDIAETDGKSDGNLIE